MTRKSQRHGRDARSLLLRGARPYQGRARDQGRSQGTAATFRLQPARLAWRSHSITPRATRPMTTYRATQRARRCVSGCSGSSQR
jgi:hypothetical protein